MAASLETSALLFALCRTAGVSSAIDFGSGFSSYVLRSWAAEAGGAVASVDDDPAWLGRTSEFLRARGLSLEGLYLWPSTPSRTYDLVFHDLAAGALREASMSTAVQASKRLVVFDDAQHRGHRAAMTATARGRFRIFSLRRFTLDATRRYAALAVRGEMHGQPSAATFTTEPNGYRTAETRGRGSDGVPRAWKDKQT
jgi:predicted O-methyltransferase YrrM